MLFQIKPIRYEKTYNWNIKQSFLYIWKKNWRIIHQKIFHEVKRVPSHETKSEANENEYILEKWWYKYNRKVNETK